MPSNEVHSEHTYILFEGRASDLHRWMDEPWKMYGRSHRDLRHDPSNPPEWAVKKYGLLLTKKMMQDHVELDAQEMDEKFGYSVKHEVLDENDRVVHVLKARNSDFILPKNQFVITQDNEVVGNYLLNEIINIELEIRKKLVSMSLILITLGIDAFILRGWLGLIWPISILFVILGILAFFPTTKILKISSSYSDIGKTLAINADEEEINQLFFRLRMRMDSSA